MRAHRRLALERTLREERILQALAQELAERTGLSRSQATRARQALARAGRVVAVPAPEGAHYPIAGWRLVGGGP